VDTSRSHEVDLDRAYTAHARARARTHARTHARTRVKYARKVVESAVWPAATIPFAKASTEHRTPLLRSPLCGQSDSPKRDSYDALRGNERRVVRARAINQRYKGNYVTRNIRRKRKGAPGRGVRVVGRRATSVPRGSPQGRPPLLSNRRFFIVPSCSRARRLLASFDSIPFDSIRGGREEKNAPPLVSEARLALVAMTGCSLRAHRSLENRGCLARDGPERHAPRMHLLVIIVCALSPRLFAPSFTVRRREFARS